LGQLKQQQQQPQSPVSSEPVDGVSDNHVPDLYEAAFSSSAVASAGDVVNVFEYNGYYKYMMPAEKAAGRLAG
jgi:hypothetical protein